MNPGVLFGKDYSVFDEIDPFNPQNRVEGFISRKPNEYYGALILTKINSQDIPEQLIMAAPKMHYPFDSLQDGTRKYKFPIVKDIEIYEKLDGTSVVSYIYTDGKTEFLTHKLRLRPFMANSKFGNFLDMWREIASKHFESIHLLSKKYGCNLAFEMYGSRNVHLILYKNSLDLALLFGVTNNGRILSPDDMSLFELPIVSGFGRIDKDYVKHYENIQKELDSKLQKVDDEEQYRGVEGTVWYLHFLDGRCLQIKCKPETVEAIHFATGGLSKNTIIATCWNAFENVDILTLDFIKQLLLEEYSPESVGANSDLILRCLDYVNSEMEFRHKVLNEYKKIGMNVLLNKWEVMRALSVYFDKNKMRKVYAIVINYA